MQVIVNSSNPLIKGFIVIGYSIFPFLFSLFILLEGEVILEPLLVSGLVYACKSQVWGMLISLYNLIFLAMFSSSAVLTNLNVSFFVLRKLEYLDIELQIQFSQFCN